MKELTLSVGGTPISTPQGISSLERTNLDTILPSIITVLIVIAVLFALFFLIYGGISFITSSGDKQKVAAARQRVIFAIVGLIVVLMAYFIVNFIYGLFGLEFIHVPGT